MSKLTNCKTCGAEVAKNAKACPSCGAKIKNKKGLLIGIIAIFVLVVIIVSVGGGEEPQKVETGVSNNGGSNVTTQQKEEKTRFVVGETAKLKDVSVTFVGITESNGSTFNEPADGNVFVLFEFDINNESQKEISVSSMLSFEGYCDDYACTFSLGALMEKGTKNQLDGTVAPGKKFNGVIGYEVPENWNEMEVQFTPDFFAGKEIVFVATK